LWLDRVLAAAAGEPGGVAAWADVARLHPLVAIAAEHEPDLAREAAARLVRLGELLDRARPWATLRLACAGGSWPVDGVPAWVAGWMDDGMFSRWVLDALPPRSAMLAALADLLSPALVDGIRNTLSAWRLPVEPDEELWP
jgi:hypothetical protein